MVTASERTMHAVGVKLGSSLCCKWPLSTAGPLGTMLRNSRRPHLRLHYTYDAFRSCFFTFKTTTFASIEEDNGEAVGC